MKAYVGQTRSRPLIQTLTLCGWGEMVNRGELPARRSPWAFDNGAFRDWRKKQRFNEHAYHRALDKLVGLGGKPDFVVVPDLVAGGLRSLAFSLKWVLELRPLKRPLYLVVQDGMREADVLPELEPFAGIFVGGTTEWKLKTGPGWAVFAHEHGRLCHVGRVGTGRRVRWAASIRADSIDSCVPLWSARNLWSFARALAEPGIQPSEGAR